MSWTELPEVKLTLPSQGFDRGKGGFGRSANFDWKLSDFKKVFNHWQVEMEKEGGWNSN